MLDKEGVRMADDSRIVQDVQEAAAWIATALAASGYRADFTMESLLDVDRFFNEHSQAGKAIPGGLLSEDLGSRIFAMGSYIGETIRRCFGGEWHGSDADPEAEVNVELILPDGVRIWPIQRAMKRFKNGREDSIVAYSISLGLKIN